MNTRKHIFVGLSGGVDSSVAALLLLEKGYRVTGIFMKNWSDCDWMTEERWARRVAAHLNIPFATWDFENAYREKVLTNFYNEYKHGRTPNPDVLCNKYIKFDLFLEKAIKEGADGIATGHYARTSGGRLFKGSDENKDQSYFLYALSDKQLAKVLFPLGDIEKTEVRRIAKNASLPNFDKKDSQGICFVGAVDLKSFLAEKLPKKLGVIVNENGVAIGKHEGVHFYTEGQREGLFLGGQQTPHYVAYKDSETNTLIATEKSNPLLYADSARLVSLHRIAEFPTGSISAKIRYRQPDQKASIEKTEDGYRVYFAEKQFALSPGQSVVFYNGDEVLGGGVIDEVFHERGLVESIKMKFNEKHAISRN